MALCVYIHTVGCAKNLVDSEILAGQLPGDTRLLDQADGAELVVVNSCGFIEAAREESIEAVLEALHLKQTGSVKRVVLMGCLSQRWPAELAAELPELDGVYGVGEYKRMLRELNLADTARVPEDREALPLHLARRLQNAPHSTYLRIADGCDHRCTYCSIPLMRGAFRSRPLEELIEDASRLRERGVKELNLIAQEISSWGIDLYGESRIVTLLRELDKLDFPWLRLLYSHPPLVDEAFAECMAQCKSVLPYLDFPVEHVSGTILKRMGRAGEAQSLRKQIAMLRQRVPGLILRTSLIVGFPGEGEREFAELYDFVAEGHFDRLGVFVYSPEEDTAALRLPGAVPVELAEERLGRLMEIQAEHSLAANEALIGQRDRILVEEQDAQAGHSLARSWRDAPEIDNSIELEGLHPVGEFLEVEYSDALQYDLFARALPEEKA